jgi:hypothetical protein
VTHWENLADIVEVAYEAVPDGDSLLRRAVVRAVALELRSSSTTMSDKIKATLKSACQANGTFAYDVLTAPELMHLPQLKSPAQMVPGSGN